MSTHAVTPAAAPGQLPLRLAEQWLLAVLCLGAGVAPLAARWISADVGPRVAYGLLVAAAYLAFLLLARTTPRLHAHQGLALAFFVLALVQVLNNALPPFVGTTLLHAPPTAGNPMASTVGATVAIQLLETAIAIIPVVAFTLASGNDLRSIYARPGKLGGWFVVAIIFCVAVYFFLATLPLRPDSPAHRLLPANGALTPAHFLALTPALLVLALSNGFEEEFLFRGLFLQKYITTFGFGAANMLQAIIFSVAHAGITYTPSAILFIVALIFPLGLFFGYLMRATNGILTPGLFHAGVDLAIYITFLSYVT